MIARLNFSLPSLSLSSAPLTPAARGVQNEPLALSDVPRIETDEKSANLLALRVIFQRERVSHSQALLELEVFLLANSASFISDISGSIMRKAF